MVVLVVLHHVWLVVTPWTVAQQVPLSMEFSRQEYWSRLSFRTPGNLPHQKDMRRCGPNPHFLCHQVDSLPFVPPGEEGHENCLVCCILIHSVGSNSLKPMDCRPPGPSEIGILQARILGWVATPSSRRSSQPRDRTWVFCVAGALLSETQGSPTCLAAAAAKSLQSCPTLCNPIDGSPPGPAFPGILQARILEWGPKLMSGDSNSKLWLTGQPCSLGGCGRLWETQKYVVLSLEFVLYNSPPWTSFIYIAGFYAQVQYKILKVRIKFSSDMTETFFNLKYSTKLKTKFLFSFCLFLSSLSLCVSYIYKNIYIHFYVCM